MLFGMKLLDNSKVQIDESIHADTYNHEEHNSKHNAQEASIYNCISWWGSPSKFLFWVINYLLHSIETESQLLHRLR